MAGGPPRLARRCLGPGGATALPGLPPRPRTDATLDRLLGRLGHEVMEMLWPRGGGSVRDVLQELNAHRGAGRQLAYTTVMTVMVRLARKGLLARTPRQAGRRHDAYWYAVALPREAYLGQTCEELARQLVADFGGPALDALVRALERVGPGRLGPHLRGR